MTEITDAEVAEIQWASSEEGKAAHRAAWERAVQLKIPSTFTDRADIGAIVWAAHQAEQAARGPDEDEPEPAGCVHAWTVLGAQAAQPVPVFMGKPMPRTVVLASCGRCGQPVSWVLDGTWTLDDLR